jgi:hypothetical protein
MISVMIRLSIYKMFVHSLLTGFTYKIIILFVERETSAKLTKDKN